VQIHHGTLLDIASTLRDVIVAEQVLAADRIDLPALQGRIKAESRSQGANAAYALAKRRKKALDGRRPRGAAHVGNERCARPWWWWWTLRSRIRELLALAVSAAPDSTPSGSSGSGQDDGAIDTLHSTARAILLTDPFWREKTLL